MGWRWNLAKKDFNKAKTYFKKAKSATTTVLNSLPTINEKALSQDFEGVLTHENHSEHSKPRKRKARKKVVYYY
jgi:hypothetical protein